MSYEIRQEVLLDPETTVDDTEGGDLAEVEIRDGQTENGEINAINPHPALLAEDNQFAWAFQMLASAEVAMMDAFVNPSTDIKVAQSLAMMAEWRKTLIPTLIFQ